MLLVDIFQNISQDRYLFIDILDNILKILTKMAIILENRICDMRPRLTRWPIF